MDSFKTLNTAWRRLEESGAATIFQTRDWCDCWLGHYGASLEPLIATVEKNNQVAAIAPLVKSRFWLGLPLRRVSFIGSGPSDYGGFLIENDNDKTTDSLFSALADIDFDLLDLHQLPESTASRLRASLAGRFNVCILPQEPTLCVSLPNAFDDYLKSLTKKFRSNTTYAERRLRRDFKYEQCLYQDTVDLSQAMDIFFTLHQKRWRSKWLPGLFLARRNRGFHQDLAARLALSNRLLLSVGFVNDLPAAALYGFKFGKQYSYYLGGFDPALAKYSVSSVLILNLIKEACDARAERFDFLRGQEQYKLRWGAKTKPLCRVLVFPSSRRGRIGARLARKHNDVVQRARAGLHG